MTRKLMQWCKTNLVLILAAPYLFSLEFLGTLFNWLEKLGHLEQVAKFLSSASGSIKVLLVAVLVWLIVWAERRRNRRLYLDEPSAREVVSKVVSADKDLVKAIAIENFIQRNYPVVLKAVDDYEEAWQVLEKNATDQSSNWSLLGHHGVSHPFVRVNYTFEIIERDAKQLLSYELEKVVNQTQLSPPEVSHIASDAIRQRYKQAWIDRQNQRRRIALMKDYFQDRLSRAKAKIQQLAVA